MRDLARSRVGAVKRAALLGTVIVVVVAACNGDPAEQASQQGQQTGSQSCAPPGGTFGGTARSAFVAWADGLTFHSADTMRAFVYGFAPDDSVRIHAAALDTIGSPYGCVYARITTTRAFPALGLGSGENYLWADSLGGGPRTIVVPADTAIPMTAHALVLHAHTAGSAPPPRIGAYGECGQCKKMWCRSGLDSAATTTRLAQPGDADRLKG